MHNHIIQAKKNAVIIFLSQPYLLILIKNAIIKMMAILIPNSILRNLFLLNLKTFILRIPSCFNNKPKNYSLIKLLFDRANGSNSVIKQPQKYTTGIESQDIFDFIKILIENPDIIPSMFGEKKILCLGDGFAYQIKELEKFLKTFSQINFDLMHDLHFQRIIKLI